MVTTMRRGVAVLALALAAFPLRAADVPGFERPVSLTAREQPVTRFVEELFGQIGVPVIVEPGIDGTVNGDFEKLAREVFDDIAVSFQLDVYHDGAVAHVFPANDAARTVMPMSTAAAELVLASARELGLTNERNTLRNAPGGLVTTGAPRFVAQIRELAEAAGNVDGARPARPVADADARVSAVRVFRLKYAWADDVTLAVGGQELVIPGIASVLRTLVGSGVPGSAPAARTRRQLERTVPGLRGQGLQAVAEAVEAVEPAASPTLLEPGSGTAPRIVADTRLNAVIVRDEAGRMPMYDELIAALDVEPTMLEIEATIIDLDTDRLRELGINWRVQGDEGEALFGEGSVADRLLRPDDPSTITPAGQGGVVSLVLGGQPRFISRIRALENQGAARIVSKPHVITLSDVEAVLDTTSTFFVRVEGEEEVDLFDVSVGTTLRVTPHVYEERGRSFIKLLVTIEDGSRTEREVDAIPIIERSTVNTQALVESGQSLLVGGLVREVRANNVNKVPVLGDIPGLGLLFRSNGVSSSRVERMFLITPRLVGRQASGRVLNAPILNGEAGDIIESAPWRTRDTSLALERRDAARSLTETLPPMGADVRLGREDVPAARVVPAPAPAPVPRERTLRERLLDLPPDEAAPPGLETVPGRERPGGGAWTTVAAPPDEARGTARPAADIAPAEDGWVEVPGSAADAPGLDVGRPDEDGWMEVR